MKRAMQLRIRLTTSDGVPGHPSRIAAAFPKIKKALDDGSRGGVLEVDLNHTGMGDRQIATIDYDVFPCDPYDPEGQLPHVG